MLNVLLPLSRRAFTIPEPTVPAPPSAKTTLSPFDIVHTTAAAVQTPEIDYVLWVSCLLLLKIFKSNRSKNAPPLSE